MNMEKKYVDLLEDNREKLCNCLFLSAAEMLRIMHTENLALINENLMTFIIDEISIFLSTFIKMNCDFLQSLGIELNPFGISNAFLNIFSSKMANIIYDSKEHEKQELIPNSDTYQIQNENIIH